MKILLVVAGYKPAFRLGGPVSTVLATAERLVRNGHEVTVFATNSNLDADLDVVADAALEVDGVTVWYFRHSEPLKRWLPFVPYLSKSMGFLYAPAMKRQMEKIIDSQDLVHTQMPYIYPTLMAGRMAVRKSMPLFYQQHGAFDPIRLQFRGLKKRAYIRAFERPIMRRATTLIALTQAEVESYRALGVETPCRVIPNGVDLPDLQASRPSISGPLQFRDDEAVILFLARLHPIKGADRLIRAFLAIHKDFPKARLVMAGPDEWGIVEKSRREIAAACAGDQVVFPGMVVGDEKTRLLRRADLFCLPSDGEGFSVSVLEAMAYSTASLLSPGCHFPEAAAAGAARICEPDPETLAKEMTELLKQPGLLREMGRKGRALVERDYSWDAVTDQLEAAYVEGIERFRCERR